MDTTDPLITFDENGYCSNCRSAISLAEKIWFPDERGEKELKSIFEKIREEGRGKEYDCIIGLSGGVDSSYLVYMAVKNGLRPLVVHVDCGWNSEFAVKNIENIVNKLNLELHTFVVDWEEMKDLQRAFFKASVPDQDIPQDHAIFAALYKFADKNRIKYVLNGYNFATECIMPSRWGFQAMDYRHLSYIHKMFGEHRLHNFPILNFFKRYIYFTIIRRMEIIYPLNYIDFRKEEAIEILKNELGWQYYGGKHYESRFTKFFQSYYLPVKFNIDKRKAHYSSLIISGQISRSKALSELAEPLYNNIEEDLEYVAKKLDWTADEFRQILSKAPRKHQDYPSNENLFSFGAKMKGYIKKITGNK
jgi:N-acetyl sugar amidotransferase